MKEITLAIPFYNTSHYFKEAVELSLENDFVKEIVVNDDESTEEEWNNLNSIVNTLNSSKIKLFRNEVNLGGFRNKYTAVQNSSCDWIYLLDSDNHPTKNTLNIIQSIENPNEDFCYIPQTLLLYNNSDGYTNQVNYNFKYDKIGLDEAQDALLKKTKWFDWFLNTGNFVFNREKYLERLRGGYEDMNEPVYACSIAFSYHWMSNGGFYKVVPGMEYYHRLRSDSYWNSCGSNSDYSAQYYHQRIMDLL
jgi:glycosyltransferase involved in cell wall biosynthesis